jgi:putative transposase
MRYGSKSAMKGVKNKAVYLALGVLPDGAKISWGFGSEQTEGVKYWLRVITEIKDQGASDILIAVVHGLKGFPEAIPAVFRRVQITQLKPIGK